MGLMSLIALIIFGLNVWAIAVIFNAKVETNLKIMWIALVLFLPIIGFVIWFFAGPKPTR